MNNQEKKTVGIRGTKMVQQNKMNVDVKTSKFEEIYLLKLRGSSIHCARS